MAFLAPVTRIQSSSSLAINTVPKASHPQVRSPPVVPFGSPPDTSCRPSPHVEIDLGILVIWLNALPCCVRLSRNRGVRWMSEEVDEESIRKLDLSNNMRSRKG
jgi:hypothetical protein